MVLQDGIGSPFLKHHIDSAMCDAKCGINPYSVGAIVCSILWESNPESVF